MKTLTIKSKTHGTHDVLLDDEDYEKVIAKNKWGLHKGHGGKFYVRKNIYNSGGPSHWLWLHRFLINPPDDMYVDHINGNPLDNRKENLRIVTPKQNSKNRTSNTGKIPYIGVKYAGSPHGLKKYVAAITPDKVRITLGYYYTAEEAALARDLAAKELWGEHAGLNFPDGAPPEIMQKIIEGEQEYQKILESRSAKNQSKQKGVNWHKKSQRWAARININGKRKHIGIFKTEEEAIKARLEAEAKYQ